MLDVVVRDADQADAERDRGIPPAVDDPVQVGLADPVEVPQGLLVHGVVVPRQQVGVRADRGDLVAALPVPGGVRGEREPEPRDPALRRPDLLDARDVGDVVVLHPREVPDQPGDRVRAAVHAVGHRRLVEALDGPVHIGLDPVEEIAQQVDRVHDSGAR